MLLEVGVSGVSILSDGFSALTSAINFAVGNSIIVLPIAIGLGCYAIKKAKKILR